MQQCPQLPSTRPRRMSSRRRARRFPSLVSRHGTWCSNGADTTGYCTNASVGRSQWQVASQIGALVLGHRRFLCDDRVFEPPALGRFTACLLCLTRLPVLTGSLAPCSWRRHGACGGTLRLVVHSSARVRHGRASSELARACFRLPLCVHIPAVLCRLVRTKSPRIVCQTSVS